MSKAIQLAEKVSKLRAVDVVRDDDVREQFVNVYNAVHKEGGEAAYEREANFAMHAMRDSEKLQNCTPMSVFIAFIDLAVQGLSLEPGTRALAYLLPRSQKFRNADGREIWIQRCTLTISGYGELHLRARAGQIKYADNPVIVYEGDEFAFGERDGHKVVNYMCAIPRKSNKIIAAFLRITRADNSTDYGVMLEEDWKRLQGYSAKQNNNRANALYTSVDNEIDPGFLAAKCIKHAFKTYPKLKIGGGSQLESDEPEVEQEATPMPSIMRHIEKIGIRRLK